MSSFGRKVKRTRENLGLYTSFRAPTNTERLKSVAIMRDGVLHKSEHHGQHWELRLRLGDKSPAQPNLNDTDGFMTTHDRFVDREEAQEVAIKSGQLSRPLGRMLLSSDLDW